MAGRSRERQGVVQQTTAETEASRAILRNMSLEARVRSALRADEMTHERVVDDALQAADRVLENRGPGELPHRPSDRTLGYGIWPKPAARSQSGADTPSRARGQQQSDSYTRRGADNASGRAASVRRRSGRA